MDISALFIGADDIISKSNVIIPKPQADGKLDIDLDKSVYLKFDAIVDNLNEEKMDTLINKINSHKVYVLIEGNVSYTGSGIYFLKEKRSFSDEIMRNNSIILYNQS